MASWGGDTAFRRAAGWSDCSYQDNLEHHQKLIAHNLGSARPGLTGCLDGEIRLAVTDDDQLVGYVCFYPDDPNGCEIGIGIGPSSNWSKGYGRTALTLAVQHARQQLKAERVWAETHETNHRAQRVLTAAGFVEVSRDGTDDYDGVTVRMIQYEHQHGAAS